MFVVLVFIIEIVIFKHDIIFGRKIFVFVINEVAQLKFTMVKS